MKIRSTSEIVNAFSGGGSVSLDTLPGARPKFLPESKPSNFLEIASEAWQDRGVGALVPAEGRETRNRRLRACE
jgi:hypothetical protein